MFKRKMIIVAIFVVGLLAISAASAADNTTDNIISTDNIQENTLSAQDSQSILKETEPAGTFDDLYFQIGETGAGETLNLTRDYIYDSGEIYGIRIDKDIIIDGQGHTIDGNHQSRIFYVTASNVTFKNITFINGYTTDRGGAICWEGSGFLYNCNFINNTAKDNGGANYFYKALTNVTITGNYTNNTAKENGGANYFRETLTNVTITGNYNNNTARLDGGANNFCEKLTNVNITGNYNNNTAQKGGGGANSFDELTNVNIIGNYTNNTAVIGGANNFMALTNVTITGNYNHNRAHGKDNKNGGGANYFNNELTNVQITGNYTDNTAQYTGGANNFNNKLTNVQITGNYNNNTAQYTGGANNFNRELTNVQITGNYTDNTAQTDCGGANNFWSTVTNVEITGNYTDNTALIGGANFFNNELTNVTITGNYTDNTAEGWGGANSFDTLNQVTITGNYNNNTAGYDGGANNFWSTVTNVEITGNYTSNTANYGGANYFQQALNQVTITGNYTGNTAQSCGGANFFNNELTNVTITGNYTENTAQKYGGANHFNEALTQVTITGNYTGNTAQSCGGANHFENALNNIIITGNYNNNTAQTDCGGANHFWSTVTNVEITGNYTDNTAQKYGGANNFNEALTQVTITGNYNNNTAQSCGGANHFENALNNIIITGNYNNNTAQAGGANHFHRKLTDVTITGNYTDNTAAITGGANHFNEALNQVTITGNYNNNTAQAGGANQFTNALTQVTINGNYTDNTAQEYGGANNFWNTLTNVQITGNYNNNRARGTDYEYGGGANNFIGTLTNVNISGNYNNNTAGYSGGANNFQQALNQVTITGNYNNNTAGYSGGANNFQQALNQVTITGNYNNNRAHCNDNKNGGGANYFNNTLTNTIITGNYNHNTAQFNGGANHFQQALNQVTITGNYTDNTAKYNGGANHFNKALNNVTITGNYTDNTAQDGYGGANLFYNNIINITITGNYASNTANYGGANYFFNTLTNVSINGNYNHNTAQFNGGANNFNYKLTNTIITGNYTDNTAKKYGGANIFHTLANVQITGNYTDNTAQKGRGGANHFTDTLTNVTITGNYASNTANYGGANNFNYKLTNVQIIGNYNNNTAKEDGGANNFWNTLNQVSITGNYNNNRALGTTDQYGGGANHFWEALSQVTITGNYTDNTAQQGSGGANRFSNELTNVTITGNYNNNTAAINGGANYFNEALENVTIAGNYTDNTAQIGGGGANNFRDTLTQVNLTGNYNHNTASTGGANSFNNKLNQVNITGNYTDNTAQYEGGANHFNELTNVQITGNYNNNNAQDNGGSNYFWQTLTNVNITGNYNHNTGPNAIYIYNSTSDILIHDSVLINQKITIENGNIKVRDTWFGNNATNYNERPDVGDNINLENWLFLNATADPVSLPISSTSEIQFKLYSYNSTGTSEYDNSRLSQINLTITAANGTADPTARLGENITYTPTGRGTGSVTASLENATYTIKIHIKEDPELSVKSEEVYYSSNTLISINYNSTATGTVSITLNGKRFNYTFTGMALNTTLPLGKINPDEYNVTVTYSGDETFSDAKAKATLTVNPIVDISVKITSETNIYFLGDIAFWTITVHNAGNGTDATNVTLGNLFSTKFTYINSITDNGTYDSKEGVWEIGFMGNGTDATLYLYAYANEICASTLNEAVAICNEDEWNHTNNWAYDYAKIVDLPNISQTASNDNPYYHDEILFSLTIENDAAANYTGVLSVSESLPEGLDYIRTENITGAEIVLPEKVNGQSITWYLSDIGNDTPAVITLRAKVHDIGNLTSNMTVYSLFDHNKTASCTVKSEPIVDLSSNITSDKDMYLIGDDAVWTITVHNAGNGTNATGVTLDVFSLSQYSKDTGSPLQYFEYTGYSTDKGTYDNETRVWNIGFMANGTDATLYIYVRASASGKHISTMVLVACNETDWNIYNNFAYSYVDIEKLNSTIEINDAVLGYGETANVTAKTEGATGITAKIDDENITVIGNTIIIPILDAGTHTMTVTTIPDANHYSATKNATITVNKIGAEITANSIITTYNINKYLVITLKGSSGNPIIGAKVTVNLNGAKTYVTDKNGQVRISTKVLNVKTYNVKISFAGDGNHNGTSAITKITVKKAAPRMTALNKAFKTTTKNKIYLVALKDNRGVALKNTRVTLRVGGITYSAMTNAKGIAVFKLAKLTKAGTYNALVKYAGNSNYNAVAKKVKLTVKTAFKTISKGSKDTAMVKKIQKALKNNGYYLTYAGHYLKIDGIYQDCTVRAVMQFQKANGLKVTGKVDELTAKKLKII